MHTLESNKTTSRAQAKTEQEQPFFAPAVNALYSEGDKSFLGGIQPASATFFQPSKASIIQPQRTGYTNGHNTQSTADAHRSLALHKTVSVPVIQRQEVQPGPEDAERQRILDYFLRGIEPSAISVRTRRTILLAMSEFSLTQLRTMERAGLRFWQTASLPPEFPPERFPTSGSALDQYNPQLRMIRMDLSGGIRYMHLMHEMTHAWDHVQTMGRRPRPLDTMSERQRERAVPQRVRFHSDRRLSGAYDAYRRRMRGIPRERSFDVGAREGYSLTSVREFYAEGYSTFHTNNPDAQARMFCYARELYDYLERESREQNLPVPDRTSIQANARRYCP